MASFNHPHAERKPGSIGTPIRGVEMRLVDDEGKDVAHRRRRRDRDPRRERDEGLLEPARGHRRRRSRTAGSAPATSRAPDDDGYFFIVDRKKEMIIRGGYNVYPREIEEALYEHPAVAEAACIGIAHPDLGEEVGAAVALKAGASAEVDELRDFVKERVAAYKYPRHLWLVDALPKGPTGQDPPAVGGGARGAWASDERPPVAAGLRRGGPRRHAAAGGAGAHAGVRPGRRPAAPRRGPRPVSGPRRQRPRLAPGEPAGGQRRAPVACPDRCSSTARCAG